MKIGIKEPCSENWDAMTKQDQGRFCSNCSKTLYDFTTWSKEEIVAFLAENNRTCGRFKSNQLDFPIYHPSINIISNQRQINPSYWRNSLYFVTVTGLLLSSCTNPDSEPKNLSVQVEIQAPSDSNFVSIIDSLDEESDIQQSCSKKSEHQNEPELLENLEFMGGIIAIDEPNKNNRIDTSEYYPYVDSTPEFIGGIDSLKTFIQTNLKYPKWEQENNIQGKVFVSLIIDQSGKIIDHSILKSTNDSKHLDSEVSRLISIMPDWKPGTIRDTAVITAVVLPINFKLE